MFSCFFMYFKNLTVKVVVGSGLFERNVHSIMHSFLSKGIFMNKRNRHCTFLIVSSLVFMHSSLLMGMEKIRQKDKVLVLDSVVTFKLSKQLKKYVQEKKVALDAEPETFEETIEALRDLFCAFKLHKARFAFNDREVEVYDENKHRWQKLNDMGNPIFYTWFNDAVRIVCDSDVNVQRLISLAIKQLSTINENNQSEYLEILETLPQSIAHRIKEEFAWSDDAFVIESKKIDYKKTIEGIKLKKRKLLLAFADETLCVYGLDNYMESLHCFHDNIHSSKIIEKYKKLVATGNIFGHIVLFDSAGTSSEPCWKIKFGMLSEPRAIRFIDKDRIAVALEFGIQIVASKDGTLLHCIEDDKVGVKDLLLLPRGILVSSSRTIKFWNVDSYQCIKTIQKQNNKVSKLLFLNNKIFIGDNILMQYDSSGHEEQKICTDVIYALAALDPSLIVIDNLGTLKVIDTASKKCLAEINEEYISAIATLDYKEFPDQRRLFLRKHTSTKLKLFDFPTFAKVVTARVKKNKEVEK